MSERGLTVDNLAQLIRMADPDHSAGAGEIAEKILPWIRAAAPAEAARKEPAMNRDELLKAIGTLEARFMRDEHGKEIIGAHWINRNDIVLILHRWPAEAEKRRAPVSKSDLQISMGTVLARAKSAGTWIAPSCVEKWLEMLAAEAPASQPDWKNCPECNDSTNEHGCSIHGPFYLNPAPTAEREGKK